MIERGKTKKTSEKHTSASEHGFSALPSPASPSYREEVNTAPLRQGEGKAAVESGTSTQETKKKEEKNEGGTKGERGKVESRTTSNANRVNGKHADRGAGDECPCRCCVTPIPLTVHYSLQQDNKRASNDHPNGGNETHTHFFPPDRSAATSAETVERHHLVQGETDVPPRLCSPIPAVPPHRYPSYTVRIAFTFPPSPLLPIAGEATIAYMALHLTWPVAPCPVASARHTEANGRGHPMGGNGPPTSYPALSCAASSGTASPIARPISTRRATGTTAPRLPAASPERSMEAWHQVCCTLVAVGVWPLQLSAAGGGGRAGSGEGRGHPSTGTISSFSGGTSGPPVTTTPERAGRRHASWEAGADPPAAASPLPTSSPLFCGRRSCTAGRVRQFTWLSSTCDYQGRHPLLGILLDAPPLTPCDTGEARGARDGERGQPTQEESCHASSSSSSFSPLLLPPSSLSHFTLAAVEEVPFFPSSPPARDTVVHLQGRVVDGPWAVHCLTLSHLSYLLVLDKEKIRQSVGQEWVGASWWAKGEGEGHREAKEEDVGGGEWRSPPISDTEGTTCDAGGPSFFSPRMPFRGPVSLSAWEREERWYTGDHTVVGCCCRSPSIPYWPKGAMRPRCTPVTEGRHSTPFAPPFSDAEEEAVPLSPSHSLFRFCLYDKNGLLAHCPLPSFVESAITLPMVPERVRHASDPLHSTWTSRRKKAKDGAGEEPSQAVDLLVARVALLVWNRGAVHDAEDAEGEGRGASAPSSSSWSAWTEEAPLSSPTRTVRHPPREERKGEAHRRRSGSAAAQDTADRWDAEKAVVLLHVHYACTGTPESVPSRFPSPSPPTPTHAAFLSAPVNGPRGAGETREARVGGSSARPPGDTSAAPPLPHTVGRTTSRGPIPIPANEWWQVVPMTRVSCSPTWWKRPVRPTAAWEAPRMPFATPTPPCPPLDAAGRGEGTASPHRDIDLWRRRRMDIPLDGCVQGFWGGGCRFRPLSSVALCVEEEEEGVPPPYVGRKGSREGRGLTRVGWEMAVGMEVVHSSPWPPASETLRHGDGESDVGERQRDSPAVVDQTAACHGRGPMERGNGPSPPCRPMCPFCHAVGCFPVLCRSPMCLHLPVGSTPPSLDAAGSLPSVGLSMGTPSPSLRLPLPTSSLPPTSFSFFSPRSFSVSEGEFSEEVVLASCTYVPHVRGGTVPPCVSSALGSPPPERRPMTHEKDMEEGRPRRTLCLLRNGWVIASCASATAAAAAPTWHWCGRLQCQEEDDRAMGRGKDRERTREGTPPWDGASCGATPSSAPSHAVSTAHAKALLELLDAAPGTIHMAVLEGTGSGVEASPKDRPRGTALPFSSLPLPPPPFCSPAFDVTSWRVVFTVRHVVVVVRLGTGVVEEVVDVWSAMAHLPRRSVFPTGIARGPKGEDVGEDRLWNRNGKEEQPHDTMREDKGGVTGVVLHQILPFSTPVLSFSSLSGDDDVLFLSGAEKKDSENDSHESEARSTWMRGGHSFFASPHAEHVFFLLVGNTYEIPHGGWCAPATDAPFDLRRRKASQCIHALSSAAGEVQKETFPTASSPSSAVRLAFFLLRCTFLSFPSPIAPLRVVEDDGMRERRASRDRDEEEEEGESAVGEAPLPFVVLSITDWCEASLSSLCFSSSASSSAFPSTTPKEDRIDTAVPPQTPWPQRYAHSLCPSCETRPHASSSFSFFASSPRWTPRVTEGKWGQEERPSPLPTPPHRSGGVSCTVCVRKEGVRFPTARGKKMVCGKGRGMEAEATSPFGGRTNLCHPTVATISPTILKEKETSVTTHSTHSLSIAEVGVLQMMWEKKTCEEFVRAERASNDGVDTEVDHGRTTPLITSVDYWRKVELLFPTIHFTRFTLL